MVGINTGGASSPLLVLHVVNGSFSFFLSNLIFFSFLLLLSDNLLLGQVLNIEYLRFYLSRIFDSNC